MAAITQTIGTVTVLPTPPNPNSPSTFDELAFAYTVAQNAFGLDMNNRSAELNVFAEQVNAVRKEINEFRTETLTARDEAKAARDEAVGAVSVLPDGTINDNIVSLTDTWSSSKIKTMLRFVDAERALLYYGL